MQNEYQKAISRFQIPGNAPRNCGRMGDERAVWMDRPELYSAANWRETSASPSLASGSCLDNNQVALDGPPMSTSRSGGRGGIPLPASAAKVKAHGHMSGRGHCSPASPGDLHLPSGP